MPLTYAGEVDAEQPVTDLRAQARKIKPQYSRGDLVHVATARQQPEADMIQMVLLEEGIPSTVRRSAGFDVPDFLAAGPRDVMVPQSGAEAAHAVLHQSDLRGPSDPSTANAVAPAPLHLLTGILVAVAVVALLVYLAKI
ncbi:MAG: hypothetical protein WDZ37_03205 [Solirubrobacterales bacterium]